jgi:REP element-mobilizing transposase RayT
MKKSAQLSLFKNYSKSQSRIFGGSLLHGRRRRSRPLSTSEAIHLVLRSSWARGPTSFLLTKNKKFIQWLLASNAKKYGIKVYRCAIVSNHLHLVIRIRDRRSYRAFIRVFSGRVATQVMNSQSFQSFQRYLWVKFQSDTNEIQGKGQAFWQFRPWSRILYWGRDFKQACRYVELNEPQFYLSEIHFERNRRYLKTQSLSKDHCSGVFQYWHGFRSAR